MNIINGFEREVYYFSLQVHLKDTLLRVLCKVESQSV